MRAARTRLLAVCIATGTARAEDLPPELVARPPTLPGGMTALSLGVGYDLAHVLGITVRSATGLTLEIQRGLTSRLELDVASGVMVHPDPGWTRDGVVTLAYTAWRGADLELAPSLAVPLTARSGVDLTSTLVLGAGLRWHVSPCVMLTLGQRLIPLPVRPAVALDIAADATVTAQLAERWAIVGGAVLGEVTIVGQTDRGVAPWHHVPSFARLVYASENALDVALELHGDARDPRNEAGIALTVARRL